MPELCLILALSEFRCNLAGLLGPRKYDTHDAGIFRFFDLTICYFFSNLNIILVCLYLRFCKVVPEAYFWSCLPLFGVSICSPAASYARLDYYY